MAITDKIRDLTFGAYNKKFLPNKTEYDWLCRSEESLNKYITDPLKGEAMSTGVFRELLEAMKYTNDKKNILKMKNIPLYITVHAMIFNTNPKKPSIEINNKISFIMITLAIKKANDNKYLNKYFTGGNSNPYL